MERKAPDRKADESLGFFFALAFSLWFTGFFAWSQTVVWQEAYVAIASTTLPYEKMLNGLLGISETLIISALFAVYLCFAYYRVPAYRKVFDGLFGFGRGEKETGYDKLDSTGERSGQ